SIHLFYSSFSSFAFPASTSSLIYTPSLHDALPISAAGSRARDKRTIGSGPKAGEVFDVTVPTQVAALLHIESGQNATVLLSFDRSEEHTSELQSRFDLVCRLLLEKKKLI